MKEALQDSRIKKVVFILHSQGGIEGGLILDWLFAEVSRTALEHLEVSGLESLWQMDTYAALGLHFWQRSKSFQQS